MAQTPTDTIESAGPAAAGEPKPERKLSHCLGVLEADPDDRDALTELRAIVESGDRDRLGEEPARLLEMARQGHELRGELAAVARLIEIELLLVGEDRAFSASLWKELGRLRAEFLLDPEAAREAYDQAQALASDDPDVSDALKRIEQSEASWKKFAKRFVEEAESASDLSLKTSLLLRAACLAWEYKRKGKGKEADKLFKRVLELDPSNRRACMLYEQILREREEWKPLAQHLLDSAEAVRDKQDRINLYVRAARVFARKLGEKSRAAACYERVLDFEPTHSEALAYLSEYFTEAGQWDHLVGLYQDALQVPQKVEVEQGILLQIGMVHWRMRKQPEAAEPHFARLRKLDPTHPAMLDYYRAYLGERGDVEQLIRILSDAQRVSPDRTRKVALAVEAAKLSQSAQGMGERAIEAWKLVQRLQPENDEAARILKDLYIKSEKWNALVEVLKAQVDAVPDDAAPRKVELLRELASVYREHLRLDGMLINAYNAILRLAPDDRATLGALADKYRELGRWNDLINVLSHDAELATDRLHKVATYLQIAGLWIEHFSNYNQAAVPLEKLLEIDPNHREALGRLRDIYEKKRAWKPLFEVLRRERDVTSDPSARANLTVVMAELAADRLHRYEDAVALWREVVQDESFGKSALEALEKLAEREKDWGTLAEVLELQVGREPSDEGKIRVLLKLGTLHTERKSDPEAASRAFRRILDIDPKQGRALRSLRDSLLSFGEWDALEALYERASDFEGLVDVLSSEADRVEARDTKIDLSLRAARVFEQKLSEPARAQRSYERVLSVDPSHARAAAALAPIYEAEEKWSRLCAVLEVVRAALPEGALAERLALLTRLRALAQDKLRDGEAAFAYALAAYELAPERIEFGQALESAAELAQAFERVVQSYRMRCEQAPREEALLLHRRMAVIASERLGRADLSASEWQKVLELLPADETALEALDRIYRAEHRTADLRNLLVHKVKLTEVAAERAAMLHELAAIEEHQLGDAEAAAVRYRALADLEPESVEVWAALDRLALAAGRSKELAQIIERRSVLETERAARIDLGARLAALLLEELAEPERAVEVFAEVLALDSSHGASLSALEKLCDDNAALRPKIQVVLEQAYEHAGRFDKLAKVLRQRLETVRDDVELRRLRLRLAEISGGKLGDAMGAYASLEAAFLEQPTDTSLWDRLVEAAERAQQHRALANAYALAIDEEGLSDADRVELATRAARIYDEILSEPAEAESFHKRVLAQDPLAETAFAALKEFYTTSERWEELQGIYRKRICETVDSAQKLDLLLQLCFLFEEILDRPEMAIEAYQEVLELAPDNGPSRRTLEKLYEQTERHRDLATLLRANLDQAEGYDQVDLLYRLGELYETKLSEPGLAVDAYEGVLGHQPHHLRTQAALARLLAVESQRQRVAAILEPVYESQGAYADLARVLEIQLADRETPDAKAALLLRIGEVHESRLKDGEAAFAAYGRAVESDPSDKLAREALARVASARETFRRRRAQVLERALSAVEDLDLQVELLSELANLLDHYLDDKVAAERTYDRLLSLASGRDELAIEVSKSLERIHLHNGDHARLAKDLERQVGLELDSRLQEQLLVRLAELYEHNLGECDGAISAQERRLGLDDTNADALLSLCRLHEGAQHWPKLIEVLGRRAHFIDDEAERRQLLRRVAAVHEEKCGDVDHAIEAYNEVLSSFGNDRETLTALARLYESTGRFADLLATLEAEETLLSGGAQRATLRFRMAELLREKLEQTERALSSYEAALEDDPEHAATLAVLDAIMQDPASSFRKQAAQVAAPRYEALGRYDKLISVLELMAETGDDLERLASLRRASEVAEHGQTDVAQAMRYCGRALRVACSHESLPDLLSEYGRFAEMTGNFAEYVTCLQGIAEEIFDIEQKVRVYRCIAEVAREKLHDTALSRASFRRVLAEQPDDMPALDALIQLDEEAGDHAALIEVLKSKTELTSDAAERARLLSRQADVYERGLDDPERAIVALEEVVAEAPLAAAYASLERLYQRTHRWADLGASYQEQLDREQGDAVSLRYRLARNCLQHLADTSTALEHLREAIADAPNNADVIVLLESIMSEEGEHRATAAEILEPGYLARMEWAKLTAALRVRVDAEPEIEQRKRLLLRLGRVYEEQLEDFEETIEIYARLFALEPRDEEQWETLARLAKVGGQWSRLAKILGEALGEPVTDEVMAKLARYVGSLYDERIVNLVKAAEFYEKALHFDSQDLVAFRAIESAYQRSGNHAALLDVYSQQADVAATDARRIELLHKRALIHAAEFNDCKRAIETYREILELDPRDTVAITSIEALFVQTEDFQGLADHLRTRIEHEIGGKDEVSLKFRLGELLWTKLGDQSGAIDVFEEILRVDPGHGPSILALERLVQEEAHTLRVTEILEPVYRHLDQWKKLIAIYEARLSLITDPGEAMRLLSEIARLHEARALDHGSAFHAYARAFAREPDNDTVRAHVDRIASRRNSWDDHVAAYEAALAAAADDGVKAQLLTTIARVHDEKRGDPRTAILAYERLLALEPEDPSTLDALEALHTMVGDWRGLVAVLERKVKAAFSGEERGDVLRRSGSVLEDLLGDQAGAIEAYRRALQEVEDDALALEALDRLYTASHQAGELSAILARRIELALLPSERAELGQRLGAVEDHDLRRADEAIAAYRRVIDDEPENHAAITRLADLYQRQGLWQDLLDNLALQAGLTQDIAERVKLRCRSGVVLERELSEVADAIELYRQALEEDPRCEDALQALMALTVKQEHRARAAEIVEPLLREHQRWDDLVKLIERRIESILDPIERRDELCRLAEIQEHGRKQPSDAFEALARALAADAANGFVQDELSRLAQQLGVFSRLFGVFMERARGLADANDAAALFRRAGRIAEEQLHEDARAIEAYVEACERDDDAPETLSALDRLYARTERWEALGDVLERRIAALVPGAERADLLIRFGELRDRAFADGHGAFVAYQEVLTSDPAEPRALAGMERLGERDDLAHDVLEVLERCYRDTGALEKLVGLYDLKIRLAATDVERVSLLRAAAALWEQELAEPSRALGCLRRAYELDCHDTALLDEVERLASISGAWGSLRGLAEGLFDSGALEGAQKRDVALRAARWYREQLRDAEGEERCLRAVLTVEPQALTVHAQLVELLRARGDKPLLLRALRAFGDVEPDLAERRERLAEAGELALELGDAEAALYSFEAVLEIAPTNEQALLVLADLRGAAGRIAEMVQLLVRALEVTTDAASRVTLYYRIAEAQQGPLQEAEHAAATYRALLDEHPEETRAAQALETLYERLERFVELEALLQRRLSLASTQEEHVAVRLSLASLAEQRLGQPAAAIEQLAAVLLEMPDHPQASADIERLYRSSARYQDLASLLHERADRAVAASDTPRAIAELSVLAKLREETMDESDGAIAAWTRIHELAPGEPQAITELVRLHRSGGNFVEVARYLQLLIDVQPPREAVATAHALAELVMTELADPARAELALRRALALDPSQSESRGRLQAHFETTQEFDKLAQFLAEQVEATSVASEQVALLHRIATLYSEKLQDPARAVAYLERAVALSPDDRAALLALCDLYVAAERHGDAIPVLEKIIAGYSGRRAKEVAIYEHRLGRAYEAGGQTEEALKHYDAAFKIDLTSVPVLRDLGRLCFARGDFDRAQKTYRALLLQKLGPDVGILKADVYFHLGEISAQQGDKVKAKAMLERAISEAGQHPAAKALLEQL